jgi:hypothetical protein
MSRDGYLVDPHARIDKSWWRNLIERVFVLPAVLILAAAVYVWILILPRKADG